MSSNQLSTKVVVCLVSLMLGITACGAGSDGATESTGGEALNDEATPLEGTAAEADNAATEAVAQPNAAEAEQALAADGSGAGVEPSEFVRCFAGAGAQGFCEAEGDRQVARGDFESCQCTVAFCGGSFDNISLDCFN
jgi:hypothetical protein